MERHAGLDWDKNPYQENKNDWPTFIKNIILKKRMRFKSSIMFIMCNTF